jgi:hypothetical protein
MPKIEIDYSNTIIYKISCKDAAVTDVYVGHTTNFVQRKHAHKQSCISSKSSSHMCKVYQVIRANGGWDNWKMEIITFFDCKDHYEARKKEQEYFISLNATLNSIEPMPKPKVIKEKKEKKVFFCTKCNIHCYGSKVFEEHNKTNKHLKIVEANLENIIKPQISQSKFTCVSCNYNCSKKSDYEKHLVTMKHKNTKDTEKVQLEKLETYVCFCGNSYNHRASLFNHRKKCKTYQEMLKINNNQDDNEISVKTELKNLTSMVLELIKNNNELLKIIKETTSGGSKEIVIDKH